MNGEITIVGAGLSGLALARELLDRGFQVRVVELRRRIGGISVIDEEAIKFLDRLSDIRVEFEKACVRVSGRTLLVSRDGVENVGSGFAATGFRVLPASELLILGDRPSGVRPFHTALDLILEGFSIGRRVALYGLNRYSVLLALKLLETSARETLIVTPYNANIKVPEGVTVLKGRIRRVIGRTRIESIVVNSENVEVDSLVLAVFKPWNPFPELVEVGHAAIEVYDPGILVEASRILAENVSCKDMERLDIIVEGGAQVFPRNARICLRRILVVGTPGVVVEVNNEKVDLREGHALVDISGKEERIRVKPLQHSIL